MILDRGDVHGSGLLIRDGRVRVIQQGVVGLGFGDVVITEILRETLGETAAAARSGVSVGYMFAEQRAAATLLANRLRNGGEKVDLMLAPLKPKQFFARASAGTSADAVFIGPDDVANRSARRKNLETRVETVIVLPDAP